MGGWRRMKIITKYLIEGMAWGVLTVAVIFIIVGFIHMSLTIIETNKLIDALLTNEDVLMCIELSKGVKE